MKKYYTYIVLTLTLLSSCGEAFLEKLPVGEIDPNQINKQENIEKVIVSAYAVLNGQFDDASNAFNSPASNWQFGDVMSDDAYKGGGGTGDQNQIHLMEIFQQTPSNAIDIERKWHALYEGVNRANSAINLINANDDMSADLKEQRVAEMRFLRGHFHFELKKIYNNICWIDENVTDFKSVNNALLSDEEMWTNIEDDFKAGEILPETQEEPARPTYWAARTYLVKCYIFQKKWVEAEAVADIVISDSGYGLEDNFRDVFLPKNDNGKEIIFAVQHSINDGSPDNYNGSIGDRLMPPGGPYANYGFFRPSQNLVNAFKTDANGLPVNNNIDLTDSDNLDPRVDHTLARPGIPYLDLGLYDWTPREPTVYGPYSPKKRMVSLNDDNQLNIWPYISALNYYIIRYADLLLWKAEAAIENGDLIAGRAYINLVRTRAINSERVKFEDGSEAGNYSIATYDVNFSSKEEALEALRIERRLEFAQEGHRFFDIVRWGIAADVMNTYLDKEKQTYSYLVNATFIAGKHEYQPIPQLQMDLVPGMVQNNY